MKGVLPLLFVCFLVAGCLSSSQEPAPVSAYGGKSGAGSAGTHTVQSGDTLWSISKRYKITMQDIAFANKLNPPFFLDSGQRLTLPPPREYKVRSGDTLYEISRLFGTSMSQIARQNNLRQPYTIQPGQVLRLPSAQSMQLASTSAGRPKPGVKPQTQVAQASAASSNAIQKSGSPSAKPRPQRISKAPPQRSSSKFLKPVQGPLLSSFGPKQNGLHNDGINISAPRGAPVRSAENGVVVYAGSELKGSGNLVLVRHEGRYMTAYAHMDRILIQRGQTVQRGQTIGTVGSTGSVAKPQLHFEVRRGTKAMNPKSYLEG